MPVVAPALAETHSDATSSQMAIIPSRSLLPLDTWWNRTFRPTTNTDPATSASSLRGSPSAATGMDSMNA